jgi:microcystin-dependent protein
MSFRQFGGLQFAAKHNAVASYYNTSNNLCVTQNVGQPNSLISFQSDISGNIKVNGNMTSILSTYLATKGGEKVGVGTTEPSYNLDISGNMRSSENTYLATNGLGKVGIGTIDPSYNLDVRGIMRTTENTYLATRSGKRVGIGTTNPLYDLDVIGIMRNTHSTYLATFSGHRVGIGTIDPSYNLDVNGMMRTKFSTYLATSSGNVGIGTTDPSYNLDISGNMRTTESTYLATSSGNVGIGTIDPSYNLDVVGNMRTTESTYLATSSGNVGIGTTTPSYNLDVVGNTNISGTITNTVTQPGSNDNSTKVPTTSWVQSAISVNITSLIPTGSVLPYAGKNNAPTGYLFCDGTQVSRTTYSTLFNIIGTTYGIGDSLTTFNLPMMMSGNQNAGVFPAGSYNSDNLGFQVKGTSTNTTYPNTISTATTAANATNPQQISADVTPNHTHAITFPTSVYVDSANSSGNTTTGGGASRLVSTDVKSFPTSTGSVNYGTNTRVADYVPIFTAFVWIIKY